MQINQKQEIRQRILTLLRNQKEEEREYKSSIICDKLLNLLEFQRAQTILFYSSLSEEVDTFEMIKQALKLGKKTGLPRIISGDGDFVPRQVEYLDQDLEIGPYGISQPKESCSRTLEENELDLVIVPGIAFDRDNHRLGRGKGYYDRFLKRISPDIPTVGLAFDFQIVDHVPYEEGRDIPVSLVLVN